VERNVNKMAVAYFKVLNLNSREDTEKN